MNTSESVQLSSKCFLYGKETRKNLESEAVTAIGGRDSALFLFRALGKILYCKSELFMCIKIFCLLLDAKESTWKAVHKKLW